MTIYPGVDSEHVYPIDTASLRTGLSKHVIRAWERRYSAITPKRAAGARRLYSEADIRRLLLLKDASEGGYRIGRVSALKDDELRALIAASHAPSGQESARLSETQNALTRGAGGTSASSPDGLIDAAVTAIAAYESHQLESVLQRAVAMFGSLSIDEHFIFPLLKAIARRSAQGELNTAHEHLAANSLRSYFEQRLRSVVSPGDAPAVVVATPLGEHHEIGALAAACQAEHVGWRAVYVGADTPARAIAEAAATAGADAVILGVVVERFGGAMREELGRLRELLPRDIPILLGAAHVHEIEPQLTEMGLVVPADMAALRQFLSTRQRRQTE